MICLLSPAHLFGLASFQLYAICLVLFPSLAPLPLVTFVLVCFIAPMFPGFSFYLPITSRGRRGTDTVALSFDDGPDPDVTPFVLALLAKHSMKATFFVSGLNAERYPELIQAILAQGHTVGNHSYHHSPFLMTKGSRVVRQEIEMAQNTLAKHGVIPLAFRPPVGISSPYLWRILSDLGMFCANFSCRIGDMGNRRIRNLAARTLNKVTPGDIIMLHDVRPHHDSTDYLLTEFDKVLAGLQEKRLRVLPLAQLINKEVMRPLNAGSETNPIESFYDSAADSYDKEQFDSSVSLSRSKELALFNKRVPEFFQGAKRVLEIGAGTGIFTMIIARHCEEVMALDISSKMLDLLNEKCKAEGISNIHTHACDVEKENLDGTYDVVCAFSSLAYLVDLPAFFRKLAPHVRPGGTVYFITARRSLFRFATQIGNAMRQGLWLKAYSRRNIKHMLTDAGFTLVSADAHLLKCLISGGMILEVVARKPLDTLSDAKQIS